MEPVKITLYTDESRIAAVLEQLGRLNLGPAGRIEVGDGATNAGNGAEARQWADVKLTHEALFALPLEEQLAYFKAHGGVLAVMKANGFGLTDADIDDWHKWKAEWDAKADDPNLTDEERLKLVYGDDHVFPG